MEAKGSSGQSTAYNTYATLLPPNPLFQGFSRSQNVSFGSARDNRFHNPERLRTFQKSILHSRTFVRKR